MGTIVTDELKTAFVVKFTSFLFRSQSSAVKFTVWRGIEYNYFQCDQLKCLSIVQASVACKYFQLCDMKQAKSCPEAGNAQRSYIRATVEPITYCLIFEYIVFVT